MGCQKMAPIVHGLERKYAGTIDFIYLHTGEARTEEARRRLGFKSTPHIILTRADGTKVREWTGMVPEAELAAGLNALLKTAALK